MGFIVKELPLVCLASYSSNQQEYLLFKMLGVPTGHFFYTDPSINLKNNL
jgi:hypothetical protein